MWLGFSCQWALFIPLPRTNFPGQLQEVIPTMDGQVIIATREFLVGSTWDSLRDWKGLMQYWEGSTWTGVCMPRLVWGSLLLVWASCAQLRQGCRLQLPGDLISLVGSGRELFGGGAVSPCMTFPNVKTSHRSNIIMLLPGVLTQMAGGSWDNSWRPEVVLHDLGQTRSHTEQLLIKPEVLPQCADAT